MFEEKLSEISEKFKNSQKKKYYILKHKKHKREVYFQNKENAVNFMRVKFNSPLKRIIYFFIKIGLLQPFLKNVYLAENFGDVIFVAGQIKGFKLKDKKVISFPLLGKNEDFIKSKKFQEKFALEGFAPKIFEINKNKIYSIEEMLTVYQENDDSGLIKRLMEFYNSQGIKKISLKEHLKKINKRIKKSPYKNYIKSVLKRMNLSGKKFVVTTLHGDFSRGQILLKEGKYVFVDWNPEVDLITYDLVRFFESDPYLLKNKKFLTLLNLYPEDIKKNIRDYIILSDIYGIIKKNVLYPHTIKRVEFTLNCKTY
ncbi:hypothetical protein J4407_00430 [Candidatus Pacearchaeota archaeon]|nr:hypothetical protein [Candidatus Pacearchaeota archaeon]